MPAPVANCLMRCAPLGEPRRPAGRMPRGARISYTTRMVCPNDRLAMIAIDTSALMAIALDEFEAEACVNALEAEPDVLISAGTLAEALIVAARRNVAAEMAKLI